MNNYDPQEIFKKFAPNARKILISSQKIAQSMDSALGSEHILLALAVTPNTLANGILKEHMISMDQIRLVISLHRFADKNGTGITDEAKEVFELAAKEAQNFGHNKIDTEHILLAITEKPDSLGAEVINKIGINPEDIRTQIENFFEDLKDMEDANEIISQQQLPPNFSGGDLPNYPDLPPMQEMPMPGKPKGLEYYTTDLTKEAEEKKLDPVIGREKEIQRAIQILTRRTKNNPVLVGEPGVGKTAIVEGLAQKIAENDIPESLKGKRVIMLDLALMIAGTMYRGQFEERVKKVLDELIKRGDTLLFVDEIHTIVGAGSAEGSLDLANILKPSLAKGKIHLIGATTHEEYRKFIEKDPALERRLQKITVNEPSPEEAVQILKGIKKNYEVHHGVKISDEAIEVAVDLSRRYIFDRFLPDKAIDLIDEASAAWQIRYGRKTIIDTDALQKQLDQVKKQKEQEVRNENFEKAANLRNLETRLKDEIEVNKKIKTETGPVSIGREDIAKVLALWTNVPVETLKTEEKEKYLKLKEILKKSIIGQDEAIEEISLAIKRSKSGMSDPHRPIGSFIFLGPTGVGKTELARVLSEELFGSRESIIKIDMSEFMERHNVSRLLGAPPGNVGYEEAGKLTEQVRQKPYSIILFDEIEKAHPEIFNILLQILEDGELTDAKGRKINFRNTIIIMTSNIGMHKLTEQAAIGFATKEKDEKAVKDNYERMKDEVVKELKHEFRPELLNRLDKVIVFRPLGKEEIEKIAKLQLERLAKRLREEKTEITFDNKVVSLIAEKGYDPHFGARPIRRAISELIENPLSDYILSDKFDQSEPIKITVTKGEISFKKAAKLV